MPFAAAYVEVAECHEDIRSPSPLATNPRGAGPTPLSRTSAPPTTSLQPAAGAEPSLNVHPRDVDSSSTQELPARPGSALASPHGGVLRPLRIPQWTWAATYALAALVVPLIAMLAFHYRPW